MKDLLSGGPDDFDFSSTDVKSTSNLMNKWTVRWVAHLKKTKAKYHESNEIDLHTESGKFSSNAAMNLASLLHGI